MKASTAQPANMLNVAVIPIASMSGGESRSDGSPDGPLFCGGAATDPNQAVEYADFMRVAFRSSLQGTFCLEGLGFRGAKDAPAPAAHTP